ncbi:B-cell receptor CD22-like isoform X1, partial [Lates japonicus]
YYCEAQNERGRQNSTLYLGVVAGAEKSAAGATITVFLLAIILLTVFLWIRRKMPLTQQCRQGERPDSTAQLDVGPGFDTPSAAAQKQPAEQQDDLHYASISFSRNQTDAVYSNIQQVHLQREAKEDEEEDDEVEYTAVRCDSGSSAAGTRHQEDWKNSFELYSTVNKNYENTT